MKYDSDPEISVICLSSDRVCVESHIHHKYHVQCFSKPRIHTL